MRGEWTFTYRVTARNFWFYSQLNEKLCISSSGSPAFRKAFATVLSSGFFIGLAVPQPAELLFTFEPALQIGFLAPVRERPSSFRVGFGLRNRRIHAFRQQRQGGEERYRAPTAIQRATSNCAPSVSISSRVRALMNLLRLAGFDRW